MQATPTNKFKASLAEGLLNFGQLGVGQGTPDSFKVILMNNSFSFNKETQNYYSDISGYELSSGYGYTQNSTVLGTITLMFDSDSFLNIKFPPAYWTATGGNLGPISGAIIFDDSISDIIVGFVDFEVDVTIETGNQFYLYNLVVQI